MTKDNPGVIAPPPLIAAMTLLIGELLDWLVPVNVLARVLTIWPRILIGALLVVAGVALVAFAHRSFKEVGTNVKPWKPSLNLATSGVYTRLRNPMYVSLILIVGGIAIVHPSEWTLVLLVPMAIVLHFGVVLREERYLEGKFGEDYRRYKTNVPRWGVF